MNEKDLKTFLEKFKITYEHSQTIKKKYRQRDVPYITKQKIKPLDVRELNETDIVTKFKEYTKPIVDHFIEI